MPGCAEHKGVTITKNTEVDKCSHGDGIITEKKMRKTIRHSLIHLVYSLAQ